MVCNAHHDCKHQHLSRFLESLEVSDLFIELTTALFMADEILELKLPSMIHVLNVWMPIALSQGLSVSFPYVIVGSLEVAIEDVSLTPGPFLLMLVGKLVVEQKLLNEVFEAPEGSRAANFQSVMSALEYL